jgi:hypothetical protein
MLKIKITNKIKSNAIIIIYKKIKKIDVINLIIVGINNFKN